jgi:hypothetical protein
MKTYKLGKQISSGPAKYAEGGVVKAKTDSDGITDDDKAGLIRKQFSGRGDLPVVMSRDGRVNTRDSVNVNVNNDIDRSAERLDKKYPGTARDSVRGKLGKLD